MRRYCTTTSYMILYEPIFLQVPEISMMRKLCKVFSFKTIFNSSWLIIILQKNRIDVQISFSFITVFQKFGLNL